MSPNAVISTFSSFATREPLFPLTVTEAGAVVAPNLTYFWPVTATLLKVTSPTASTRTSAPLAVTEASLTFTSLAAFSMTEESALRMLSSEPFIATVMDPPVPSELPSAAVSLIAPAVPAALFARRLPETEISPSTVSTLMPASVVEFAAVAFTLPREISFLSLSATYVPVRVWFTETLPPKSFAAFSATTSAVASSAAVSLTSTTPRISILPLVASASRLPAPAVPTFKTDSVVPGVDALNSISVPERFALPPA